MNEFGVNIESDNAQIAPLPSKKWLLDGLIVNPSKNSIDGLNFLDFDTAITTLDTNLGAELNITNARFSGNNKVTHQRSRSTVCTFENCVISRGLNTNEFKVATISACDMLIFKQCFILLYTITSED